MKSTGIAFAVAIAMVATPAAAAPAPRLRLASLSDLAVPDRPYDESANADAALGRAFARAKAEHKRLLIDLGGNWCADCRILSGVMQQAEVQTFLDAHYVAVLVDVGRFDRNLQIPARFGIEGRLEGVPAVLIADPDGTLVNRGHIFALDDARNLSPQAIADWLAQWTK